MPALTVTRESDSSSARGAGHRPVLLAEVLELLAPQPGESLIDGTFGGGGHARAILQKTAPNGALLATDVDPAVIDAARAWADSQGAFVRLEHAPFDRLPDLLTAGVELGAPTYFAGGADLLLVDLGMSSTQLDDSRRGFSFRHDGPFDLRLDQKSGRTARELIAGTSEDDLAAIIREYGEERFAGRIARELKRAVAAGACETTTEASTIVVKAMPAGARHGRIHAATRTFQALRIAVNDEIGRLRVLLRVLPELLAPGGRAGAIAFHSLEDREVKHAFRALAEDRGWEIRTKRPVVSTPDEIAGNPRARSAKLRVIARPR